MDNDETHQGLDKKEVRDLLSEQFRKTGWRGGAFHSVEWIESQIARLREELALARRGIVIREIAADYGWKFHDISDEYEDYDPQCFDFVGTAEEFAARFGKGSVGAEEVIL